MSSIREYGKYLTSMLGEAGVDSPGLCARMLISHVLRIDALQYILSETREISPAEKNLLELLAQRRANGEPMAYILGKKSFYEHDFIVSPATLVPRPETEMLVDLSLNLVKKEHAVFADIGCGSGCIGLSILAQRVNWRGILVDLSLDALKISRGNTHIIAARPAILAADMFSLPIKAKSLDLVVSNPPYINAAEMENLYPELAYEPPSALFSMEDGLAHIKKLVLEAGRILREGGIIIMEHGYEQGARAMDILRAAGFNNIQDYKDLAGLPRCATASK